MKTKSTHTPGPSVSRCKECKWVHEADSTKETSFMGVELCPLHESAPELLEALKSALTDIEYYCEEREENPDDDTTAKEIRNAIAKATGGK